MTNEEIAYYLVQRGDTKQIQIEIEKVLDSRDRTHEDELVKHVDLIFSLNRKLSKAKELIDGCMPVIESWAVMSVSQAEWKKKWLADAKQTLSELEN